MVRTQPGLAATLSPPPLLHTPATWDHHHLPEHKSFGINALHVLLPPRRYSPHLLALCLANSSA